MAVVTNGRHLFNEIPQGFPEPGKTLIHDTSKTVDLENANLNGGFLIKTLVLSIDPYMRGKMRDPSISSYSAAYVIGEPLDGHGVGVVLRSENPHIKKGDHLYGNFTFEEYVIRNDPTAYRAIQNEEKLPWHVYIGAAGMPGQTAYYGWKEYASPQKGDVAFITAGAGPVGSFAIQLAKMDGLKVIASAGSEEKVKFLREIGADVAFNYKTTNTREVLEKEGPIDIYWDNVGGETLEAAIDAAATSARFIECGMISTYNGTSYGIKNLGKVVGKCIHLFGFLVFKLAHKYDESFYQEIPAKIAKGELKYTVDITKGLENAGQAILDVQSGKNKGKSVVLVADDLLHRKPPTAWEQFVSSPLLFFARKTYSVYQNSNALPSAASIRVVCISDTHNAHEQLPPLPDSDILIHAGDLTQSGSHAELVSALSWLDHQPHPHKVFIAGNHDAALQSALDGMPDGLIYLEDSSVSLDVNGRILNLYGSPQTPRHGSWPFQYPRAAGYTIWSSIPLETDVLITHGPPAYHLDLTGSGCSALLHALWAIQPRLHVFGHIHGAHGVESVYWTGAQKAYEDICSGVGGWRHLITLLYQAFLARIRRVDCEGRKTVMVNAASLGGLRDERIRGAIVVYI